MGEEKERGEGERGEGERKKEKQRGRGEGRREKQREFVTALKEILHCVLQAGEKWKVNRLHLNKY